MLYVTLTRLCRCTLFLLALALSYGQDATRQATDPRTRISDLVQQIKLRSEGVTPEGIRVTWSGLPMLSEIKEVKQFGSRGVEVLTELLPSQNPRECQVTLRFLGNFHMDVITRAPVSAALDQRIQANCRELSVRLLRDAPMDVLKPLLQQALHDPSPGVRRVSAELLAQITTNQAK